MIYNTESNFMIFKSNQEEENRNYGLNHMIKIVHLFNKIMIMKLE